LPSFKYGAQITINIDDSLLELAAKLSNIDNQSQVIELAFSELN